MHILFVLGGMRIGGYEVLSVRMANELVRRNVNVGIVSISDDAQILEMVDQDVQTYFVPREFKFDLTIVPKITMIIDSFKPDIILTCSFLTYYVAKAASLLNFKKQKIILAFHVTEPFDQRENKWMRVYSLLARHFDDRYVAIHNSQVDFYSCVYGLPKHRFFVIRNGVDTSYFKPGTNSGVKNDDFLRIAHIASLKPLKDQWTLLKSMVEFNRFHSAWELKIAGADLSGLLSRYQEYAKENNISSKVRFLGAVNDVRDILKDSDVFVLTSLTEALPLSVIEAMSMGLPCVVTNVGGNSDIIENGKEGFLVKPGDYKAISQYLQLFIQDPIKRKTMGAAARRKAVEHFDFKTMVDRYYGLFESLMGK